jgi:CRISPR-associated protein Cmr5
MKRIQPMISTAMDVANEFLLNDDQKIDKEFNGYISSFGASVISAGLLPSVIFFSQKGETASDRPKVIKAIEAILKEHGFPNLNLLDKVKRFFDNPESNRAEIARLTDSISDAAIALKLAIRTFPKTKND